MKNMASGMSARPRLCTLWLRLDPEPNSNNRVLEKSKILSGSKSLPFYAGKPPASGLATCTRIHHDHTRWPDWWGKHFRNARARSAGSRPGDRSNLWDEHGKSEPP